MDTYAVGQALYRGYADAVNGVRTVEVKLKSRHGKFVKITTEWRGLEVFTPGAEYIYTEKVRDIAEFYAPTPTEALKILRDSRKLDLIIQEGVVTKIESDIRAISRAITDLK